MRKKRYDLFVQTDADGKVTEWWLKSWRHGLPLQVTLEREGKGEPPADVLELVKQRVCYI